MRLELVSPLNADQEPPPSPLLRLSKPSCLFLIAAPLLSLSHLTSSLLPMRSGITWMTKEGLRKPNYFGSLTHAATVRVGNYRGEEIHVPFSSLLPMVHPNDFVLGGWDISGA